MEGQDDFFVVPADANAAECECVCHTAATRWILLQGKVMLEKNGGRGRGGVAAAVDGDHKTYRYHRLLFIGVVEEVIVAIVVISHG